MPANPEYAPTTWGVSSEELTVPSGQKCLARRPDMGKLIASGKLNQLDMLTSLVDQKHVSKKAQGGKNSKKSQQMQQDIALARIAKDPEKLAAAIEMMDHVAVATVIQPPLQIPPENWEDREDGVVYTDTIALEDKIYLMNYAFGGTRDIARFRGQLAESVDRLADVEDLEGSAQQSSGN